MPLRVQASHPSDDGGHDAQQVREREEREAVRSAQGQGDVQERAARIANDPDSSQKGGKASGSGKKKSDSSQGGTTAQKKKAGRKGGKAAAKKS